jgi:hypothetical protein
LLKILERLFRGFGKFPPRKEESMKTAEKFRGFEVKISQKDRNAIAKKGPSKTRLSLVLAFH